MVAFRRHGRAPWSVVAIHGGPGACGELAPLAARLGRTRGVLEPHSTATTIDGEIEEIEATLRAGPVDRAVVIGHSWGAWLATLHALRHPERVAGLVWIGCGPFDAAAAAAIAPTRLARLSEAERAEVAVLEERLAGGRAENETADLGRLGRLFARTDAWDPIEGPEEPVADLRPDVFRAVWPEAAALRASGELRRSLGRLSCPVVAFHGDHDPHPVAAIAAAGADLAEFRLHRLARCGHAPWREKAAAEPFFALLEDEIARLLDHPSPRSAGASAPDASPKGSGK